MDASRGGGVGASQGWARRSHDLCPWDRWTEGVSKVWWLGRCRLRQLELLGSTILPSDATQGHCAHRQGHLRLSLSPSLHPIPPTFHPLGILAVSLLQDVAEWSLAALLCWAEGYQSLSLGPGHPGSRAEGEKGREKGGKGCMWHLVPATARDHTRCWKGTCGTGPGSCVDLNEGAT